MKCGVVPTVWKQNIVVPVHKQGDVRDHSNYRPISLSNCALKLFERMILNRIEPHVDPLLDPGLWGQTVMTARHLRMHMIVVLGNLDAGRRNKHDAAVFASWKETAEVLARWGDQFVCEKVWVLLLWLYGARLTLHSRL